MLKRKLVVVALVLLGLAAQSAPAMAARGWQPGNPPGQGAQSNGGLKGFSDGPR